MTIGEKIQKLRNESGLSQEELGQKLLVDSQTISLWEENKAVPTIDNLTKMKEVFGVPVDELSETGSETQDEKNEPSEYYKFNFSETELEQLYRLQGKKFYKKYIIATVWSAVLAILFFALQAWHMASGFFLGMFYLWLVSYIKGIRNYNRASKKSAERISKSTYEYKLFEDYFTVDIYRGSEKVHSSKNYYKDTEQINRIDKWSLLQLGGILFILRNDEVKENSRFYSSVNHNTPTYTSSKSSIKRNTPTYTSSNSSQNAAAVPSQNTKTTTPFIWRITSIIFFIASILSIYAASSLESEVSNINPSGTDNMWVFFLLTPIPIMSIILGFVLKSKGYKYLKNIIVGIIMTVLLCMFGSFTFIFADVFNHSDEPVIRAEQMTGIDIPEYIQINTHNMTNGTHSDSISRIYFDDSVTKEFEKQIAADDKWLSEIPNDLIGITSMYGDYSSYDYILIYNTDTSEFNKLPDDSGIFDFISIFYRLNDDHMMIVEYTIDYIK